MAYRHWLLLLLPALVGLMGCGAASSPTPTPAGTPVAGPISGTGSIAGKVRFVGRVPKLDPIVMDAVPACARQYKGAIPSQELELAGDAVKNAFVYVSAGLPVGASYPPVTAPVRIDQKACVYAPRVLGVRTGQPIEVFNSDPMAHNVKPVTKSNEVWSASQPPNGPVIRRTFTTAEQMVSLKCNLHPWMAAYIGVMDHPYFAVTDGEGNFNIAQLPPGKYTLIAWQERLGQTQLTVEVGATATETELVFGQ